MDAPGTKKPHLWFCGILLGALLCASPLQADLRLEVAGTVLPTAEALEVRLAFTNRGDAATSSVEVEGELLGHRLRGRLAAIPAGEDRVLVLRYPPEVPRPGVHALTLVAEYGPASGDTRFSQCLFLLLALGARAEPPVTLAIDEVPLDTYGPLTVRVTSADAQAHQIRLRLVTPRGLRGEAPLEVAVPATRTVEAHLPILRSGAPRDTRQGVLVVAEEMGGAVARVAAAPAVVRVLPDPAWMPRLRWPLLALALVLVLVAFVVELRAGRA